MDFSLSEEAEAVQQLAEQVFTGSMSVDRVKEVEASEERIDRSLWKELASTGLLGIGLPESAGGAGLGLVEVCLVLQAQGRRVAPVPYWPTVLAGQTLASVGQDERLAAVVAGDSILTVALEPGAGSVDGDRVTGEWPSVPALHVADAVIVFVGDEGWLVDTGAEGVGIEPAITTNRGKVGHLRLDGAPGLALGPVREHALDRALVMLAAISLGACEEATRMAAEYTSTREQFGKPLSTNQGVVLKAADAYIAMDAMRVTLWQAAWRLDEGLDAAEAVEVAHWWASEGGHQVVHITQHLHGGMGADIDYPVHRYFLWAKEVTDQLGGPSAHLARLGDMIADEAKGAQAR